MGFLNTLGLIASDEEIVLKPILTEDDDSNVLTTPYTIQDENWYKTIPYGFRIMPPAGGDMSDASLGGILAAGGLGAQSAVSGFFFPVNPESINISTPYAVQITPTLGGIVEEHSGAVFYNITVSGTTGIIPDLAYIDGKPRFTFDMNGSGRNLAYEPTFLDRIQAKAGFGGNTYNAIKSAYTAASNAIFGIDDKTVDSDKSINSGYTAYHVLYKFLWLYHDSKSKGSQNSLQFVNYKDNNQYNIVIQNFQLSRDKSRPHLYQFSIQMRGWKLETQDGNQSFELGPLGQTARLAQLGLNEGPSFKAQAFRIINTTKTVLNTAKNILTTAAQDLAF